MRGGKLTQSVREGQRDTIHITLRYMKTMVHGFTVHSKTLQLHIRNNQLSNQMTYLLIITLTPSPIPSQIPHSYFIKFNSVWMQFLCHDQDTASRNIRCITENIIRLHMISGASQNGLVHTACFEIVPCRISSISQ